MAKMVQETRAAHAQVVDMAAVLASEVEGVVYLTLADWVNDWPKE